MREAVARQFGKNIVRARKRLGLSQEDVAFRASIHRTEIGMLERGVRVPQIDTFVKLAAALEVTPGVLLDGISWEPGYRPTGGGFSVEPPEPER